MSLHEQLKEHANRHQNLGVAALFEQDSLRVEKFSFELNGIYFDFSKHPIDKESLGVLLDWADKQSMRTWRQALFEGELVNHTEQRAALHMALRGNSEDKFVFNHQSVMPEVLAVREHCFEFAEQVRQGKHVGYTGKKITTIVNIGIGGSDLGPQLLVEALADYAKPYLKTHFISRLDGKHINEILQQVPIEETLFVVVSKTFTTQETLQNALYAKQWLIKHLGEASVAKHFVAVSANPQQAAQFGIDAAHIFHFWDWVGGRYSLWSAAGLSAILALGEDVFSALLSGARLADQHFLTQDWQTNIPFYMGALSAWYARYWQSPAQAILSYDENLRLLASYLQQLEMESNGKSVDRQGNVVEGATGGVIFGGLGNDGQHAYYQALHQGNAMIAADFLVPLAPYKHLVNHHQQLLANAVAQSQALMQGKSITQVQQELVAQGVTETTQARVLPYKVFKGNIPNTMMLYPQMTPERLGTLLACYEHKVFVQSVLWDINPFDQWGVELGKQLASALLPLIQNQNNIQNMQNLPIDDSTKQIIEKIRMFYASNT